MKRTRLRKVSKRYRSDNDLFYNVVKPKWLSDHPRCQFVYDREGASFRCPMRYGCTIHHMMGRGRYLNDTKHFMTVCPEHHEWIENNKKAARAMGYIRYR